MFLLIVMMQLSLVYVILCLVIWIRGIDLDFDKIKGDFGGLRTRYHEICKRYKMDSIRTHLLEQLNINEKYLPSDEILKRIPKHLVNIWGSKSSNEATTRFMNDRLQDDRSLDVEDTFPSSSDQVDDHHRNNRITSNLHTIIVKHKNTSRLLADHNFLSSEAVDDISESPNSYYAMNPGLMDLAKDLHHMVEGLTNTHDRKFPDDPMRTYFHISNISNLSVKNAVLSLYVRKPKLLNKPDSFEFNLHIYRYVNASEIASVPVVNKAYKIAGTARNDEESDLFLRIDLTSSVKQWVTSPKKNFGILIRAVAEKYPEDLVNRNASDPSPYSHIFLNIEFDTTIIDTQIARNIVHDDPICSVDQHEDKCCRYQLQVDFEAMGWNWIISPKRYDAFYCAGSCPFRYRQSTVHTHLMQQYNSLRPSPDYQYVGQPCCSPKEYRNLKLVYISPIGTVHERTIPDMMATRCGCA